MKLRTIALYLTVIIGSMLITSCAGENSNNESAGSSADQVSASHPGSEHPHNEVELAILMGHLQRFADKLYFAGKNQNWSLASFYIHELEEGAETIEKAKITEDGKDVSALIGQMLIPQLKQAEKAVASKSLPEFEQAYTTLVNNCNTCHGATDHGFIKIIVPNEPTYRNQDFKPVSLP